MRDRGFKSTDIILQEKGCRFCKQPSVSTSERHSNELVHEAKVVAALRVRVMRVIRRIREYSFLALHAGIPSHLVSLTDYAIVVSAGLVSLQPPLIVA
jgi:radical SAM superfamily enzyme with C-terminal helix-hairpin-helix motif